MHRSSIAALIFLAGLVLAAWCAARTWDKHIFNRFVPIAYCLLFGLAYSLFVVGSTLADGLLHSLMAAIVGAAIVFGLWVDSGSRSRGED